MKEYIQETVSKRFRQLPNDVQDVILSDTLATALKTALESAHLSGEDFEACKKQVTLVLVGLATTKEFKAYLSEDAKLAPPVTEMLFSTLSSTVFVPVRDCLLKAFDTASGTNTQETTEGTHNDPYREQTL